MKTITKDDVYIGVFVVSMILIGIFFDIGPVCMTGWNPMLGECSDIVKTK
jgi:hypothetical protein